MSTSAGNPLGNYLKDRRAKLDPAAFGMPTTRRRTPGLRREEVALRANVSATWYTWLEQGRGGAPSSEVLDRLATALALTAVEREHLFLLAQNRPPEVSYKAGETITPQLQHLLDSLETSPAIVKTAQWDIIGWNAAAAAVLTEYGMLPPDQRNVLKLLFASDRARDKTRHWEDHARFAVAAFRADIARLGATDRVRGFVDELIALSPQFEAIWNDYDLQSYGEGRKQFAHPLVGEVTLDYSAFSVDGRPELGLIIFTPATTVDKERVATLVEARQAILRP
ncbi:MAG TPA: helix-turn-helix transcriptional regulator [Luteibacter sp.]|uniref:helix-turn-helix transcriptional regulator n=1 Tax=Luteibacter sp. TaxID=1886636 RepID=UPI002B7AEA87|nr:helix-turn-helix transcriptional regulator [Luteibacter sp.]HVI54641.1 helix-turn-helix transcriptional regulator [Luteibacter sp.]